MRTYVENVCSILKQDNYDENEVKEMVMKLSALLQGKIGQGLIINETMLQSLQDIMAGIENRDIVLLRDVLQYGCDELLNVLE